MVLASHPDPLAPVLSHFSLVGRKVIVVGGSRGIGLAVAEGLLEAGADVAITYSSTPLDHVSVLTERLMAANPGRKVLAYQCNVTDRSSVDSAVSAAARDLGGLDIAVANAGIAENYPAEDYPEDKFRNMLDVNLNGVFWTAQAAANIMKARQRRGSIIFTASVSASLVNIPQKQAAYNASKAAVVHLAKSLAVEWVDFARVNCISPGFISTEMLDIHPRAWREKWLSMVPAARLCEPSELKGSFLFLASDASSYVTGANLIVDGGYTLT